MTDDGTVRSFGRWMRVKLCIWPASVKCQTSEQVALRQQQRIVSIRNGKCIAAAAAATDHHNS